MQVFPEIGAQYTLDLSYYPRDYLGPVSGRAGHYYHAVVDSSEPQPTPLPPSAASPLAISFRALCDDLRGVNGGLKATTPPLVPPRPTGSTRAHCI